MRTESKPQYLIFKKSYKNTHLTNISQYIQMIYCFVFKQIENNHYKRRKKQTPKREYYCLTSITSRLLFRATIEI